VVSVDDLPPANSLLQFSGSFNQIIGLSLGGVFVAAFGIACPSSTTPSRSSRQRSC